MVSRKKAAGKARKAAKAKAKEEEEAEEQAQEQSNNQTTNEEWLEILLLLPCKHGAADSILPGGLVGDISQFVLAFRAAFRESANKAAARGDDFLLSTYLIAAHKATLSDHSSVWNDSTKMEMAMSFSLCMGTVFVRNRAVSREIATYARYFEQHIAVEFKQTQVRINWVKINEIALLTTDHHTLVKFFRMRIPCSCLDEKYEEVKSITKMGLCYNPQCITGGKVERSKTKYCSRCRSVTYCSRACQVADWLEHKADCDKCIAFCDV